jgi:hypothetical protein
MTGKKTCFEEADVIEYVTKTVALRSGNDARIQVRDDSWHDIDELAVFAQSVHGIFSSVRLTLIRRLDKDGSLVLFGFWSSTRWPAGTRREWATLSRAWEGFACACSTEVYFTCQMDAPEPTVFDSRRWWQIDTEDADLPWNRTARWWQIDTEDVDSPWNRSFDWIKP